MPQQQGLLRRGIHHLVYGFCAIAVGITPPTEKQEVPFFLILVGGFVFIGLVMYFVATTVTSLFR
jgi:hypothetical protein